MKIKNKILLILILILSIFFLFSNRAFASYEQTINDTTYLLPDWVKEKQYQLVIIRNRPDDYLNDVYDYDFFFYCSDSPFVINGNYLTTSAKSDIYYELDFNMGNGTGNGPKTDFSNCTDYDVGKELYIKYVLEPSQHPEIAYNYYTNHDILNISNDEVVFHQPVAPFMVGVVPLETIVPTQVQETIAETLETIIPIAILVFSALLSPFLIRYLISRLK